MMSLIIWLLCRYLPLCFCCCEFGDASSLEVVYGACCSYFEGVGKEHNIYDRMEARVTKYS